ncbi:CBS domain-containing protein [Salirhabdus sp. Marseille-P4669]|uniref:CBS domain-containing protein n=1 Tax=Salirhabdus sp. Marseille-P4669 TaxID=2042310 RepID=UPI0013571771|nr:CBS domain-containing protein [Salirhabdus sp. Marseille-P4669]
MNSKNLDNVQRFELAFNRIHARLKELSKGSNSDRFVDLLQENKDKYSAFRYHFYKLKQYAKLRNAIVHEEVEEGYYIAEPHMSVVEDIERISESVFRPPSAYKLATKPVIHLNITTPLEKMLEIISRYGYSQYPVYDGKRFKGLITDGGIARWLSDHIPKGYSFVKTCSVSNVLETERKKNVAFMAKHKDVYELENLFTQFAQKKLKLEAVIITETGDQHELPIGIITSWDLLQIDHSTNFISVSGNETS